MSPPRPALIKIKYDRLRHWGHKGKQKLQCIDVHLWKDRKKAKDKLATTKTTNCKSNHTIPSQSIRDFLTHIDDTSKAQAKLRAPKQRQHTQEPPPLPIPPKPPPGDQQAITSIPPLLVPPKPPPDTCNATCSTYQCGLIRKMKKNWLLHC
jgi:hypothetical protein